MLNAKSIRIKCKIGASKGNKCSLQGNYCNKNCHVNNPNPCKYVDLIRTKLPTIEIIKHLHQSKQVEDNKHVSRRDSITDKEIYVEGRVRKEIIIQSRSNSIFISVTIFGLPVVADEQVYAVWMLFNI